MTSRQAWASAACRTAAPYIAGCRRAHCRTWTADSTTCSPAPSARQRPGHGLYFVLWSGILTMTHPEGLKPRDAEQLRAALEARIPMAPAPPAGGAGTGPLMARKHPVPANPPWPSARVNWTSHIAKAPTQALKEPGMSTSPAPGKRRLQGQIERVSIHGFRSLAQVNDLQLPALTVLIGSNGAGKSNFIRFFEMLGWMMHAQKLQAFIQEQGYGNDQLFMGSRRTPRMWAEIRIRTDLGLNDYRFGLTHVSAGDTLILDEEAYRYSDTARTTQAPWSQLPAGTREAGLVEAAQNPKNKTARVLVHLLRQCLTYQFHDTSSKAYIKQP